MASYRIFERSQIWKWISCTFFAGKLCVCTDGCYSQSAVTPIYPSTQNGKLIKVLYKFPIRTRGIGQNCCPPPEKKLQGIRALIYNTSIRIYSNKIPLVYIYIYNFQVEGTLILPFHWSAEFCVYIAFSFSYAPVILWLLELIYWNPGEDCPCVQGKLWDKDATMKGYVECVLRTGRDPTIQWIGWRKWYNNDNNDEDNK